MPVGPHVEVLTCVVCVISHWHLAEYLPTAVREYFLLMVADFLYRFREKVTPPKCMAREVVFALNAHVGALLSCVQEGELRRKRTAMVEALSDTLMHADNEVRTHICSSDVNTCSTPAFCCCPCAVGVCC